MTSTAEQALLVVDTDVLIDYLRDQPEAVAFLESQAHLLAASVITVAELYVGVRDGEERQRLDAFVAAFGAGSTAQATALGWRMHSSRPVRRPPTPHS